MFKSGEFASPEEEPSEEFAFPDGWKDILEAPDAVDYQHAFEILANLTQEKVLEDWAQNRTEVQRRWKKLIEKIAYLSISEDDLRTMTQSEIIETALLTLTVNLETLGWIEEGSSLEIVDLSTGEPVFLNLRETN